MRYIIHASVQLPKPFALKLQYYHTELHEQTAVGAVTTLEASVRQAACSRQMPAWHWACLRQQGMTGRGRGGTCALCGKACQVMTPARMASSTAARAVPLGQCSPMPIGQSRYMDTSHDCAPQDGVLVACFEKESIPLTIVARCDSLCARLRIKTPSEML